MCEESGGGGWVEKGVDDHEERARERGQHVLCIHAHTHRGDLSI